MNSVLLKLLIPAVLTPLLAMGKEAAKKWLEEQIDKDAKKGQANVGIVYCACKGYLDEIVQNTTIPYDDQAVQEIETMCEEIASEKGFELQKF